MAKLTKALTETLNVIATKTNAGDFGFVTEADGEKLVKAGLVETNSEIKDDEGRIAARATEAGMAEVFGEGETLADNEPEATQTGSTASYGIMQGVVVEKPKRSGGGRKSRYPIASLEVGQGFFVADEHVKGGNAYQSMSSVINTAETKTFAEKTGSMVTNRRGREVEGITKTREFERAPVQAGVAYGEWTAPANGVYVSRVK